jgi:hypothetical protein
VSFDLLQMLMEKVYLQAEQIFVQLLELEWTALMGHLPPLLM